MIRHSTRLADLLAPVSRPESVVPTKEYRILGAHWYAKGLYVKEIKRGSEIQARVVYKVKTGDFVYNRLFAWKGSFALASEDIDECYVSNEFPCFLIDNSRIDPKYLTYYFSRESSWNEALGLSSGGTPTSRNRLKEDKFLSLTIALPNLDEQHHLVTWISEVMNRIDAIKRIEAEVEKDISALLMSAYREITRAAPRRRMEEVAPLNRRPAAVDPSSNYPQVSARSFGRGTFHKTPLAGSEITWQKPFLVKAGDLLISNIKAWEGAIAVATPEDDNRYGSHRYLTCVPIPKIANARFVCFHLLTPEGMNDVGEASPGSADRNRTLNTKALLDILIPVPPFEKQQWFEALSVQVQQVRKIQVENAHHMDALVPSVLDRAFNQDL